MLGESDRLVYVTVHHKHHPADHQGWNFLDGNNCRKMVLRNEDTVIPGYFPETRVLTDGSSVLNERSQRNLQTQFHQRKHGDDNDAYDLCLAAYLNCSVSLMTESPFWGDRKGWLSTNRAKIVKQRGLDNNGSLVRRVSGGIMTTFSDTYN